MAWPVAAKQVACQAGRVAAFVQNRVCVRLDQEASEAGCSVMKITGRLSTLALQHSRRMQQVTLLASDKQDYNFG
jgi:hypothetical protein